MADAPLLAWLEAAPRTSLPTWQRLEMEVRREGIRVQVSAQGSRIVGCTVPWERLRSLREDPFPDTIRRCSELLIERYASTPVPATEPPQVPAARLVVPEQPPVPAARLPTPVPAGRQHDWVPSLLGHGTHMCRICRITNAEVNVLGESECRP